DCSQIGSLNSIELNGFNYETVFTGFENNRPLSGKILLNQNYPNPFAESTSINWQLPQAAHVVLKIYDFTGREVQTLVDCEQAMGEHKVDFNAASLPAGVYFYRLQANGIMETKKMICFK
ncbi:MAG TPA: T9SS type A sorting domain-containing protein, partial [Bacteroidales bacterium]|nr:T9SS type A sorting domain-containing protein [Bacteroidales bacterium]